MQPIVLLSSIMIITIAHPNVYHDCTKIFDPQNYVPQLPSLSLPYINNIPIPAPNIPLIRPSPVITTKVINVVTKYVSKSPVCIKVTGKKPPCQGHDKTSSMEYVITKEYFVKDSKSKAKNLRDAEVKHLGKLRDEMQAYKNNLNVARNKNKTEQGLEGSEKSRALTIVPPETPKLDDSMRDLLIEDRLDKLEDILPHYTRMRVYQTSTITVTKTTSNNKATATLMVKNCVPEGFEYCKTSHKKRKSKIDSNQFNTSPDNYDNKFPYNYKPLHYG